MALSGDVPAGPLALRELFEALSGAGVRFVITGSLAASAWTGETEPPPGDLDVVPELSDANLARLAALLGACGARPIHRPEWKRTLSPEACARWKPEPATAEQLDHQLTTPWGLLDVVPTISGEFARLMERAVSVDAWGTRVWVAHPEDLLATLRPDREEKHRRRRSALEAACALAAAGSGPRPWS